MISNTTNIANGILGQLKSQEQEMLSFLKELVALESPSRNPESQHRILKFLEKELNGMGFYTIHVHGKKTGGYLFARPLKRDKRKPLQLMVGHCDTVWELDTLASMPLKDDGKSLSK